MAGSLTFCRTSSYSNRTNFHVPTFQSPTTTTLSPPASSPSHGGRIAADPQTQTARAPSIRKRQLGLSALAILILDAFSSVSSPPMAVSAEEVELERYTDSEEGFTLLKPSSWTKVDKAGATVLFEKGSNNVGVVVTPVRLSNLRDFGTPEFVADKLIQAEKRKESTKEAEVIRVGERVGADGVQVYEFEYKLDSTRGGLKRIFSAAFVASNKLYLLNVAHTDKPENPLDNPTRTMLEQVLHSFDHAPPLTT